MRGMTKELPPTQLATAGLRLVNKESTFFSCSIKPVVRLKTGSQCASRFLNVFSFSIRSWMGPRGAPGNSGLRMGVQIVASLSGWVSALQKPNVRLATVCPCVGCGALCRASFRRFRE